MKIVKNLPKIALLLLIAPLSAQETNASKPLSWHEYDPKTRTETWRLTPEKQVEWIYDACGNRIEWKDWSGTARFSYDAWRYLSQAETPDGQKILYQHDPKGNLIQIAYPSGEAIHYDYAPGGVLSMTTFRGQKTTYTHRNNLLVKRELPNGIVTEYGYRGRYIQSITHTNADRRLLARFEFRHDNMGNRIETAKTTPFGTKTTKYDYDRLYRLIQVTHSDGSFEKYTYDARGNRLTKETRSGVIKYEYDGQDRLIRTNDTSFTYDSRGNLIEKSSPRGKTQYSFNDLGHLVGYQDKDHTIAFTYNGESARLSKTVDGQTTRYAYDNIFPVYQVLSETTKDKTRQNLYDRGCLGYAENDAVYYYLEDSPGNPAAIVVDERGEIVEELEYDAFGKCLSPSRAPLQYNGEHVDGETGLVFLRTRYYDPEIGRFLSPDQVSGSLRNPQSLNRYVYVNNNPVNFRDPLGTAPEAKDPPEPALWAMGVPIWQEGDPLPPPGHTLVALCAREGGAVLNNPDENGSCRALDETGGHFWQEFVDSQGVQSSVGASKSKGTHDISSTDYIKYKHDKSTVRIGYIVPDAVAQEMRTTAEIFAYDSYNLFTHNCVHTGAAGAQAAGITEFFSKTALTQTGIGPAVVVLPNWTPSSVASAIQDKINVQRGWDHPLITPPPELKNEIIWMHLASDDIPSLFAPAASFQLESQFLNPSEPILQRGNFGGISLSKRAEIKLNLKNIYGAVFDEKTQQLILLGEKSIQFPQMRLDDFAVAVQSIYGLKGNLPEDPGISIDAAGPDGLMNVRYYGATQNTEFGKILFDGDYTLKALALGYYPCHVGGFRSVLELEYSMSYRALASGRVWIVPECISLVQSPDGSSMMFETVKMKCLSEADHIGQIVAYPPYEIFARHFTEHYDAISDEYPIFKEIKRLGQITGVVKWLKDTKIPFDLSFFQSYAPNFYPTPISVPEIQGAQPMGRIGSGGIALMLNDANFTAREDTALDPLAEAVASSRPGETIFSWEFEDLQGNSIAAEAVPIFKTRKTGDFRKSFVDLQFPAPGDFPLTLTRFYDSFNELDVGFGIGWSIAPFSLLLGERGNTENREIPFDFCLALIAREVDQEWVYTPQGYNEKGYVWYLREDGQQKIYESSAHIFYLLQTNGAMVAFNEQGQLIGLTDRNDIQTTYAYEDGRLASIEHQNGKTIRLTYRDGRAIEAVDPLGNKMRYEYDNANQLAQVMDKKGRVYLSYSYDSDMRLTHIFGPKGDILFEGGYDEYNRLSSIHIGEQELKKEYSLAGRSSLLTASDGSVIESKYDRDFRLIGHRTNGCDQWETVFQDNGIVETALAQEGEKTWKRIYDPVTRLTQVTDLAGAVWKFVHREDGQLLLKEDPQGDITYFHYDAANRLIGKCEHADRAVFNEATKSYNVRCDLEHFMQYAYNSLGRITFVINRGEQTRFKYDENGILCEIQFPSGSIITRSFYDDLHLKSIRDGNGLIKLFRYDNEGHIVEEETDMGITRYDYVSDKKLRMIDRCGNATEFEYGEHGELEAVIDAEGIIHRLVPSPSRAA